MDDLVINSAYLLSMIALAIGDVLRLRVLLLGGQALFLWWGILIANGPTMVWNSAFLLINAVMIARIIWERRPVAVPKEFMDIYQRVFAGMRPRDFLMLWELGDPHRRDQATLVTQGEVPSELQLVVSGSARVVRDGDHIANIQRGGFVAEMSLLTGKPASADVKADGPVEYLAWSRRKLANLERLNPALYLALHKALGRDVSRKAIGADE